MLLLEKVFQIINASGLQYCIQNKYEMMPEEIPSDIDMMYKNASEEFLDNLVKKVADETGLIVTQKICQGYYEYTYIISYPAPKKFFQLQLDFYRAISRRGYLNIMPAEEMIDTRRFYKCFYVPDYYIELKYMWIRRTIKKDLKQEHIEIAKELYARNPKEYGKRLKKDFGQDVYELVLRIFDTGDDQIFYKNFEVFNQCAKAISRKNSSVRIRLKYLQFMLFTVIPKRVFHKCGVSIAFLSPDGGGKTTIINRVRDTAGGSFYGEHVIYMRPRLFKNIGHYNIVNPSEEDKTNIDPHGKKLNNPLKSIIRFVFYNLDYQLGTLIKIDKYKMNKQLVIFDRYYYDYFVDLKRYQYNFPQWVPYVFSSLIPKPDLIFILNGSADCLYERKQELTKEELRRQIKEYKKIAGKYSNAYLINVERDIESIVKEVTEKILRYCNKETLKIMK